MLFFSMRLRHASWIKDNRRFQRLYRRGRFHNLKELSFYFTDRRDDRGIALSIARKLKGAVARKSSERRIRAYFQMLKRPFQTRPEFDYYGASERPTRGRTFTIFSTASKKPCSKPGGLSRRDEAHFFRRRMNILQKILIAP